jgi:hypothetical protein
MVDSSVLPTIAGYIAQMHTNHTCFFAIANISGAHGERNRGTIDPDLFVEIDPCSAGQEAPSIL